jgi:hypothetical protein
MSLLQEQQIRLLTLNTLRELFRSQIHLRNVLRRPGLHWLTPVETDETTDPTSPCPHEQGLLIQRLLAKATQPTLIKAIFSREELEVGWSNTIFNLYNFIPLKIKDLYVLHDLPKHDQTILFCIVSIWLNLNKRCNLCDRWQL